MNAVKKPETRGYMLSIGASMLFACVPVYMQFLTTVDGLTSLLHRVFWQFSILLALILIGRRSGLFAVLAERRQLLVHLLTAPLIGVQWWIFIWAPVVDQTVELAIGYLILPVSLALVGALFLAEKLSPLKIAAAAAAICGLAVELSTTGTVSWVSAIVFVGYPLYFLAHRLAGTMSSVGSLCIESGLVTASVLFWLLLSPGAVIVPPALDTNLLLFGLGVLSLSGMLCYLSASRALPLHSFGLLSYLEPILLLLAAVLVLGEAVSEDKLLSYSFFAVAFGLVCSAGIQEAFLPARVASSPEQGS